MRALLALLLLALAPAAPAGERPAGRESAHLKPVDLELVLAADVSDSMTVDLGRLQRAGYAAALRAPLFAQAVGTGPRGRIALAYVEWGDAGLAQVVVPWTEIAGPDDAARFADALDRARIARFTRTSISHALAFSLALMEGNGFAGDRRVIDVSGNGPNNQGAPVAAARDAAVAAGVTINGLPILAGLDRPRGAFGLDFDRRDVAAYYEACVVGGPGAFVLPVRDAADFATATLRKLLLEIAGLPRGAGSRAILSSLLLPAANAASPC